MCRSQPTLRSKAEYSLQCHVNCAARVLKMLYTSAVAWVHINNSQILCQVHLNYCQDQWLQPQLKMFSNSCCQIFCLTTISTESDILPIAINNKMKIKGSFMVTILQNTLWLALMYLVFIDKSLCNQHMSCMQCIHERCWSTAVRTVWCITTSVERKKKF